MTEVLFLTSEDVSGLAKPEEYVKAVRKGYKQRGGNAPTEPRTKLTNSDPGGMFTGYMAILPETGAMGGYMYSAGFEKKDSWFVSLVYDANTGEPLCLIDGASMNPFKTGAVGAVAVDLLAREKIKNIGILGSGAQARGQLRAIDKVRNIKTAKVYSPTVENRERFATEMSNITNIDVKPVENSSLTIKNSDIVVTATTSKKPVFEGKLLEEGTHINAIGQYNKDFREVDVTTVKKSIYVPDLRKRVFQDAGSFLYAFENGEVSKEHIHAELGEIVAGKKEGRVSEDEITLFDSGGTAIETISAAYMLYKKAKEKGIGKKIKLSPGSKALTGK